MNKEFSKKSLQNSFLEACKDIRFKKLLSVINVEDSIAMKYTSSLQDTVSELEHCANCPGLAACQNRLEGHVMMPEKRGNQLVFSYAPCKYESELKEKENSRLSRDKELELASFKDIDLRDRKRAHVIKWLKNFLDNYEINGNFKGLYLHGNFGSGKTYLIAALFNELKKKRVRSEIVYFPELLRDLKSNFDELGDTLSYLEDVDLLLIDDIGAEKVTEWSRDEILGTILQKRMNNYKTTFFTSNLNIEELANHLGTTKSGEDSLKAYRILERIKQLTQDLELISENRRK